MAELDHYEHAEQWTAERHLGWEADVNRFNTTIDMIPAGVKTLLDVGCGNGAFMYFIEQRGLPISMVGLERSTTAMGAALCVSEIRSGSADQLPFGERSVDLVSALEVIEHLPYGIYETALREMERVASKYILISVPYQERRRKVICPYCGCRFNLYYHLRSFDDDKMRSLFESFELIEMRKLHSSQYLFRNLVWSARSLLMPERSFPATTCPQCSYSKPRTNQPSSAARTDSLLKQFFPRIRRIFWVIALYRRSGA